jgi:hypothetical protein
MSVFWILTPCGLAGRYSTNILQEHTASIFSPEDEDNMFLQNNRIYLQVLIALEPR